MFDRLSEPSTQVDDKFVSGPSNASLDGLPTQRSDAQFPACEKAAQQRLADFAEHRIANYDLQRDRMDLGGTSELSPYLRFGLLSAEQAARKAIVARGGGAEAWLSELAWRDFYFSVLAHFPHVTRRGFRPEYDAIAWDNHRAQFEAWSAGMTGYPMVDAAMRQLLEAGWIHNRARMIVASFLTKDLLIDWRWGER